MQNQFSFYKNYELLDCGEGRRLERFGDVIIDRPAKQAVFSKKLEHGIWDKADAVFDNSWSFKRELVQLVPFDMGLVKIGLKFTASGQVGLFPEQVSNWEWLLKLSKGLKTPVSTLNGFAYTGASTLFASYLGDVCHVDGSKASVKWASDNVRSSGFETKSIRWIVDDVMTFMKREIKRGQKYGGFILDPPAFGRGKDGSTWAFKKDISELLELVQKLSSNGPGFFILSCHDVQITAEDLKDYVVAAELSGRVDLESFVMSIPSSSGNSLQLGTTVRFKKVV